MKDHTVDWLLETNNPSVRLQALRDLQHKSDNDKDVVATRRGIPNYRPVRKTLEAQTKAGFWSPKDDCYRPKWTSAVWQLALLGELETPPDSRVKSECERFFDLHQVENGSFVCPPKGAKGPRYAEPCLTGNMIRTLIKLGYSDDPRLKKAIDWMPTALLEDGGWNCDVPERKVNHSSFMSTIEPLWAYSEIPRQKWTRKMKRTVDSGAEFLLMHHIYKSDNHHWQETYPIF